MTQSHSSGFAIQSNQRAHLVRLPSTSLHKETNVAIYALPKKRDDHHGRRGHDHYGRHGRHGRPGQHGHHSHYGHHGHQTEETNQRGQTGLTYQLDFPGNL